MKLNRDNEIDNRSRENTLFDKLELKSPDSQIDLGEIGYKGDKYQIAMIRDDSPSIQKVHNLWYKIYIEEKSYPINERVNLRDKLYMEPQSGQVIAMIKQNDDIIGTVKFADERHNELEFDYHKYIDKNKKVQELSKFMVLKNYRNRILSTFLLKVGNEYINKKLPADYYGINSAVNMLDYYVKMGFTKISDEIIHPTIGNISYLLVVDTKKCDEIINKLWGNIRPIV